MAQQTKNPQDRFTDASHDPYEQEANAIFNRSDMQSLDDQGDAIIRDNEQQKGAGKSEQVGAEQKERESAENAFGYTPHNSQPQKKSFFRGISKKKAIAATGAGGGIITILIALFSLSPFGAFINLKEVSSSWADRFSRHVTLMRTSKLYETKYYSNPDSCGAVAVRCKLKSGVKDKDIEKLRLAGIEIDDKDIITSEKSKKKYLKAMSYTDANGNKVRVTQDNFRQLFRTDPKLLSSFQKVASMRGIAWRGTQALKKFALFKVDRASPLGDGKTTEENIKNMRQSIYGEGSSDTNVASIDEDENNKPSDAQRQGISEFNDAIDSSAQELREQATADGPRADSVALTGAIDTNDPKVLESIAKSTAKSSIKGALVGAIGKIDSICTMYQMVRVVSFGAKLYKVRALIKYAGIFMTMADMAKMGKITSQQASDIANILLRKSTDPASKGMSFSDSEGYTLMTQGKIGSKASFGRFAMGTPANRGIDTLKEFMSTGGVSAATCSKVKSWWGQIGLVVGGVAVSIATGGANAISGAAMGIAEGVIFGVAGAYLTPWLIQYAAGVIAPDPLTDPEGGYGAGNAIVAGIGAFGSQIGRGNGLRYIKNSEKSSILATASKSNHVMALAEEMSNPTNPSEALAQQMATSFLPLSESLRSLDASSLISSVASLSTNAFTPLVSAADEDYYRGEFCADDDYKALDIATDAFCNPIMSHSDEDLDHIRMTPEAVQNYMISGGATTTDESIVSDKYLTTDGSPAGEYLEFMTTCIDGDAPLTADGYNADLSSADTKACTSSDIKYQYFRFFTTDINALDAQDAAVEDRLGVDENVGASGTQVRIATYNVLSEDAGAKQPNASKIGWQTRTDNMAATIRNEQMDVVGAQEMSEGIFNRLQDSIGKTYDSYPSETEGSGGASIRTIWWNQSKFKLESSGRVSLPRECDEKLYPWVKLSGPTTGEFYVFNNHFSEEGPGGSCTNGQGPELREAAAKKLIAEVERIVKDGKPVFLTGDFNSKSTVREDGKDGNISPAKLPYNIFKGAQFNSAYDATQSRVNPQYSSSHGDTGTRSQNAYIIDHIFVKGGVAIGGWENVIETAANNSSDHSPIIANVIFPAPRGLPDGGDVRLPVKCEVPAPGSVPNAKAPASNYSRVNFRGVTLNERTKEMVLTAEGYMKEMGINSELSFSQGSYNRGVGASGGTHDGGGAIDLNVHMYKGKEEMNVVKALRMAGFAAWPRYPSEGFSKHIHGIALGDREAAQNAKHQMRNYFEGTNGLTSNAPDTGASVGRPYPDWAGAFCTG